MSRATRQNGSVRQADATATFAALDLPAYAQGRAGTFDPRLSLYKAAPTALDGWKVKMATADSSVARVSCIGDSITFGYLSSTAQWDGAYPNRLRAKFARLFGDPGTGFRHLTDYSTDTRIVQTGTWTRQAGNLGIFGYSCQRANGTAQTMAFTPTQSVDSFNVYYLKSNGGGTFTISVDGGAPTNVNSNASGAGTSVAVATVSAGSLGTHTVTVAGAASGDLYLLGFEGTAGTKGIRISNVGKGGGKYVDFVSPSAQPAEAAGGSFQVAFDLASPDLTIFQFGANEYLQNYSVAQFKTNAQTAITRAKAKGTVLLVVTVPNQDQTKTPAQADYATAVYDLADSNGLAVVDMSHRWKSYTAVTSRYGDGTHPNGNGYEDMASVIFDVLTRAV